MMLSGISAFLVLVQLTLLPRYRRLPFSLSFWSFSFPAAAVCTYASLWCRILKFPGWQFATVVLVSLLTVGIGALAIRSAGGEPL